MSETGWSKTAGSVSSLASGLNVVVPQGITTSGGLLLGCGNRGPSQAAGTPYPPRRYGHDRVEATGGVDQTMRGQGIPRELVRASATSWLEKRGSGRSPVLGGESSA